MTTLLDKTISTINRINSADIAAYPQRCVTVRNRNASCRRCAQACTSGAITVELNELSIDPSLCVGCGTCATMCPTCALEARRPNDYQLMNACIDAAQANDGTVVVACRQVVDAMVNYIDTNKIVGVECLGRVDESLLLGLVAQGFTKVRLVQGTCEECEHKVGLETAHAVVETANALLAAWNKPAKIAIKEKLPRSVAAQKKDFNESRRNMFFRLRDDALGAAGVVVSSKVDAMAPEEEQPEEGVKLMRVMSDGTLPHFIPDRRERLLDALFDLGEPQEAVLDTRLWGHVTIDVETCSSCQMCATFCPTGAIVKFAEDGKVGIDHYPGDCVKCRCCEDICPTKALKLHDDVSSEDIMGGTVQRVYMKGRDPRLSGPKKAQFTMRKVLDCEYIFDR